MATALDAEDTFDAVRRFYKPGAKSSNKSYERPLPDSFYKPEILAKHANREAKRQLSHDIKARYQFHPKSVPALQAGACIYNSGNTAGNCGIMALVAMFIAIDKFQVEAVEVVHVTAYNRGHRDFSWNLKARITLEFGHSWLELGRTPAQTWAVDPWAGLWCRKHEYKDRMEAKLEDWAGENKRIDVNWIDSSGTPRSFNTPANAKEVKALLLPEATHEFIYPLTII